MNTMCEAHAVLQQEVADTLARHRNDRQWTEDLRADASFTAQYVLFKHATSQLSLEEEGSSLRRRLLHEQLSDGSWASGHAKSGDVSTTVEAYTALRLLGSSKSSPHMERARCFVRQSGGVARVRLFTRFLLATFGLFPWTTVPQVPAELFMFPERTVPDDSILSFWSRWMLISISVIRYYEPSYALPHDCNADNGFLDELWLEPTSKFDEPTSPQYESTLRSWNGSLCTNEKQAAMLESAMGDELLAQHGSRRRKAPLGQSVLHRCVEWLLQHHEEVESREVFFPAMCCSVQALLLAGIASSHPAISHRLAAIDSFIISDEHGSHVPFVTSCIGTAQTVSTLSDAGMGADSRVVSAAAWLRARQPVVGKNDQNQHGRKPQATNHRSSGWSNLLYTDANELAATVTALVKQDGGCVDSQATASAIDRILDVQHGDGSWGVLRTHGDARWLYEVPFGVGVRLPETADADTTGRVLECFGIVLAQRKSARLDAATRRRVLAAAARAIGWLAGEQAVFGGWWGQSLGSYYSGTSSVLCGLACFAAPAASDSAGTFETASACAQRALLWLEGCQHEDGGWGEASGRCGPSTAFQTSLALSCLLRYRPASCTSVDRGVQWLLAHRAATDFSPASSLGAYARCVRSESALVESAPSTHALPQQSALHAPSVLIMAPGEQHDIDMCLSIGQRVSECRVRVATHIAYRSVVEQHGFEFYDIGGRPEDFRILPASLGGLLRGEFAQRSRAVCSVYSRLWQAVAGNDGLVVASEKSARPFVADVVIATPSSGVHAHAAEKVQAALVLASSQPSLPTREYPHMATLATPEFSRWRWCNLASFFLVHFWTWLIYGPFLNHLREKRYGMRALDVAWATRDFFCAHIPHICLWSSSIAPKAQEWNTDVTVGGFAETSDNQQYEPPADLETFLASGKPVFAVNFAPESVSDPAKSLGALVSALADNDAVAVVSTSWSAQLPVTEKSSARVYLASSVPHAWLLPRVHGFIHHGSSTHVAAGLRAGVPQLLLPFCADQCFWANRIYELDLGPPALTTLAAADLGSRMRDLLAGPYKGRCTQMAMQLRADSNGADIAATEVMRQVSLPQMNSRCAVFPTLPAYWRHCQSGLLLSGAAAARLASAEVISWDDLDLQSRFDWEGVWRQSCSSFGMMHIVRAVTQRVNDFWSASRAALNRMLGDADFSEENDRCQRLRDPVRKVRIEQAIFDMELCKQHAAAFDEANVEQRWEALVHDRFCAHFTAT